MYQDVKEPITQSVPPAFSPGEKTAAQDLAKIAVRINSAWHRAVDSILEAGQQCALADASMNPDDKRRLMRLLVVGPSSFSKLVRIGVNYDRLNRIKDQLPVSFTSTYEIAGFSDDELADACAEGLITDATRRQELIDWRDKRRGKKPEYGHDHPGDEQKASKDLVGHDVSENAADANIGDHGSPDVEGPSDPYAAGVDRVAAVKPPPTNLAASAENVQKKSKPELPFAPSSSKSNGGGMPAEVERDLSILGRLEAGRGKSAFAETIKAMLGHVSPEGRAAIADAVAPPTPPRPIGSRFAPVLERLMNHFSLNDDKDPASLGIALARDQDQTASTKGPRLRSFTLDDLSQFIEFLNEVKIAWESADAAVS